MKRITTLIISCLITILAQAQTEHFKFMGIPLNGTIDQFQAKLQSKGIKHDVQGSKNIGKGVRLFSGVFAGEQASIFVYYNEKNRIVYRAKSVIDRNQLDACKNLFYRFKDMLIAKYQDAECNEDTQEGYPTYVMLIPNNSTSNLNYLGRISIFISYNPYSELYGLYIDYEDYSNSRVNQQKIMDDL